MENRDILSACWDSTIALSRAPVVPIPSNRDLWVLELIQYIHWQKLHFYTPILKRLVFQKTVLQSIEHQ